MGGPDACMYFDVVDTEECPIAFDTFTMDAPDFRASQQKACRNQCGDALECTILVIFFTRRYPWEREIHPFLPLNRYPVLGRCSTISRDNILDRVTFLNLFPFPSTLNCNSLLQDLISSRFNLRASDKRKPK